MTNRDRDGYYSLLGITPDAISEQVEEAYKSALKAAAEQPGTDIIRKAAETAYAVLCDSKSSKAYDPAWTKPAETSRQYRSSEGDADGSVPENSPSSSNSRGWVGSDDDTGGDYPRADYHGYTPGYHYDRRRDPLGYYQLLLVSMDATDEEIYTVYHARFTLYPPASLSLEDRHAARGAFEVLSDTASRTAYDPAWQFPSNLQRARPGWIYADYLRNGGTPHSANRPFPPNKASGCLGVIVFFVGSILFFV